MARHFSENVCTFKNQKCGTSWVVPLPGTLHPSEDADGGLNISGALLERHQRLLASTNGSWPEIKYHPAVPSDWRTSYYPELTLHCKQGDTCPWVAKISICGFQPAHRARARLGMPKRALPRFLFVNPKIPVTSVHERDNFSVGPQPSSHWPVLRVFCAIASEIGLGQLPSTISERRSAPEASSRACPDLRRTATCVDTDRSRHQKVGSPVRPGCLRQAGCRVTDILHPEDEATR